MCHSCHRSMAGSGLPAEKPWLEGREERVLTVEVVEKLGLTEKEIVELPEGFDAIGENLFKDSPTLKEVYIPNGIWVIYAGALAGCENLEKIRLPEHVVTLKPGALLCNCERDWQRIDKTSVYRLVNSPKKPEK